MTADLDRNTVKRIRRITKAYTGHRPALAQGPKQEGTALGSLGSLGPISQLTGYSGRYDTIREIDTSWLLFTFACSLSDNEHQPGKQPN